MRTSAACFCAVLALLTAVAATPPRKHRVTVARSENGSILPSRPGLVADGGEVTLSIFPKKGYHLDSLLVDGVPVRPTDVFVLRDVREPHHVAATFALNEYVIVATAERHAKLTPVGIVPVKHGRNQTFVFSADPGFKVLEVLVDGSPVPVKGRYTFSGVKTHHRIVARTAHHASVVIAPEPGELWLAGETREVRWQPREKEDADSAVVLVSLHGPDGPWEPIWRGLHRIGSAQWPVPAVDSDSLVVCVATLIDEKDVTGPLDEIESWLDGRDYSSGLVRVRSTPGGDARSLFFVRAVPSPATTGPVRLEYSVAIPGEAVLEIYTVSGREVWRHPLGYASTGRRSATWDGRIAGGGQAEPGVYFARLTTRHGERKCRLVLLP